jgi:hypothetical protein
MRLTNDKMERYGDYYSRGLDKTLSHLDNDNEYEFDTTPYIWVLLIALGYMVLSDVSKLFVLIVFSFLILIIGYKIKLLRSKINMLNSWFLMFDKYPDIVQDLAKENEELKKELYDLENKANERYESMNARITSMFYNFETEISILKKSVKYKKQPESYTYDKNSHHLHMALLEWLRGHKKIKNIDTNKERLKVISRSNPRTLGEMRNIDSIDSAFVKKYGEEILKVLTEQECIDKVYDELEKEGKIKMHSIGDHGFLHPDTVQEINRILKKRHGLTAPIPEFMGGLPPAGEKRDWY